MAKTVSRMPSWAAWLLQFICGILAGFAFISAIFILVKYILSGLRIAEGTGLEKTVGNGFKAVPWATWVMAGGSVGLLVIVLIWLCVASCVRESRRPMLQLIAACTVAGTFIASGVSTAVGIFGKDTFAPCDPNALGLPGQSWTNSSSADQLLDTVGGFSLVGGLLSNETIVCPLYKANMWVAFIIAILFLANSIPTYRQAIRDQENARANQAAIASAIRYDALQGVNDPEQQGLYQQQPQQYQQYNQQGGYAQQEFYYQQQQQGTTEEQKNLQGYDHPPVPMYAQNTAYNPYGQQK